MVRGLRATAVALTIGLACTSFVFAESAKLDARALTKQMDEHLRAGDADAITTHLTTLARAYPVAADDADRARLLKSVARVLRFKDDDVRSAALDAFDDMGNAAAWRYYRSLLRGADGKVFRPLMRQAIQLTGSLTPEAAVPTLTKIMKKAKRPEAAAEAMRALGRFGASKHRVRILGEIVQTTRKEKPGYRGRDNPIYVGRSYSGADTRDRWQALVGTMVRSANELTGRNILSAEDWFALWRENRRDPRVLFVQEQ